MEQLGLGVRLELDDNMSQEINPIIRDLERLRRQAQSTTRTFNDMRNAHNPFGSNRRQEVRDYYTSMQSADRALLSVSDRLIQATKSANSLSKAMNRAQFSGNFNMMYRDIVRVQTMLGNMGYGMSKMQREMANMKAYNMMDVQIKDLHDRIKLTTQALKEMQSSPNASKMTDEINVAKRALQAYQNELKRTGSLQNKLAETHGLSSMKSFAGGKDMLVQDEKSFGKNIGNRVMGLANTDLALASAVMTKSLLATEKALVGTGYTALETKRKVLQLSTAMTTLGTTLTSTVSLVSAMALGGWGYLAGGNEKMNAQFTGQSLTPIGQSGAQQAGMREVFQTSSGSERDSIARMFSTGQNAGLGLADTMTLSGGSNEIAYAHGIDSVEVFNSAMSIAKQTGHSYADSLDLVALGLRKTGGDLDGATEAVLTNAGAFKDANGQWRTAFDTLEAGNKDGSINRLIMGVKGLANVLTTLWEHGMKNIVGGLGDLISKVSLATDKFLDAHPAVAKFVGTLMGLALVVGILAPPIILVTGFLVKFRSVIQGMGLAIQALSARGGVAVLGAQSSMLARNVHGATVALARFPQTLLFGVIPALFSAVRMIPNFILNMMRINPIMGALTVGMLAYSQNWFGFGDTVKGAIEKIKTSYNNAKGILNTALNGGDVDIESYSKFEQVLAKTMGTAKIAKQVLTSIFTGEELKFEAGEANLIEQLGIGGAVQGIADFGRAVKDFTTGFIEGIELVYNKAKTFVGWMIDTFEPVIVRIANFISKLFGGKGDASSIEDIMNSANGANETMQNLGKMAGVALTALLGFKLVKPLLGGMFKGLVKNPFAGIITSANNARRAVSNMGGAVSGTVRGALSRNNPNATALGNNRDRAIASATGSRALGGGQFGTVLRDRNGNPTSTVLRRTTPPPMNATQQRRADILTTNANARDRGHDVGAHTAIRRNQPEVFRNSNLVDARGNLNDPTSALNGRQIHRRQQSTMSRALFGQAYDVYREDGRRVNVNRQGGLLRSARFDGNMRESMGLRDRASLAGQNAVQGVRNFGSTVAQGARSTASDIRRGVSNSVVGRAGRAFANTPGAQRIASNARTAMKPVSVPVKYIMGRLQTAGIVRQGQQGGQQSGNRFKRAFNMASRGLGGGARMFSGAVSGATSAGRKAGSGMLKGMNFMGKGISGIFKLGLRAIPFLGWALMAWDIISAVFTNWDKIKSGAQKAWTWIQTSGMTALGQAWDWIKEKATAIWNWIQTDGLTVATNLMTGYITFMGQAWTWIITKALEVLAWILTDGIAMAIKLGAELFKWIATDAFPKIVAFAGQVLTGFISTAGSIASSIGSAMWNGITNALSGLGSWLGKQISKVPGGSWVVEKLTGKKYARGGIINSPHMGIVGEAGPEAIIPLSGNQRNRAQMLLEHTAGVLGMTVQQGDANEANSTLEDVVSSKSGKLTQNVVRSSKGATNAGNGGSGTQDNSVTINNVHINLPQGAQADTASGRKVAQSLAKELQKLLKQERLRSSGKNLTLEDLILNM